MSDLGWLKMYLDGLVGDDMGYAEIEWAVNEIKNLRASTEFLVETNRKALEQREEMFQLCKRNEKRLEVEVKLAEKRLDEIVKLGDRVVELTKIVENYRGSEALMNWMSGKDE
jgi:hypothetical protein